MLVEAVEITSILTYPQFVCGLEIVSMDTTFVHQFLKAVPLMGYADTFPRETLLDIVRFGNKAYCRQRSYCSTVG